MSLLPGTKATKDTGERRGRAAGRSEKQDDHSEGLSARVGVVFIQISRWHANTALYMLSLLLSKGRRRNKLREDLPSSFLVVLGDTANFGTGLVLLIQILIPILLSYTGRLCRGEQCSRLQILKMF